MTLSPVEQLAALRAATGASELAWDDAPDDDSPTFPAVQLGPELARILALPRRPQPTLPLPENPTPADVARVAELDELCRLVTATYARHPDPWPVAPYDPYTGKTNPRNTGRLNPGQAAALQELWMYGGVFGPLRAGSGKTLLGALACAVTRAQRPLFLCPASLRVDMHRAFTRIAAHWRTPLPEVVKVSSPSAVTWTPGTIKILSYDALGRKTAGVLRDSQRQLLREGLLERLQPDLVIFDEAHRTANLQAAVTRRVRRWRYANPNVPFVDMSGTMMRTSLLDFGHLAEWSMPRLCPVPRRGRSTRELRTWADAVDERDTIMQRPDIGALALLCSADELAAIDSLRSVGDEESVRGVVKGAIGRRILETPGCIATQDGPLSIPLTVDAMTPLGDLGTLAPNGDAAVDALFTRLRTMWELPNGWPIADGLEMARHLRKAGLGGWQTWDPPPPPEWYAARREWASFSRDKIRYNRSGWDSEDQVKDAVKSGALKDDGRLAAWEAVKPTYDPKKHVLAVMVSDAVFHAAQRWLDAEGRKGSIIWMQDIEIATQLSRALNLPYYGADGLDARGRFIMDHPTGQHMIASARANKTGRDGLQHGWSDNLLLTAGDEQLLARTHRPGQMADVVRNTVYIGCREHVASFWRACRDAKSAEQTLRQAMRLCYAEKTVPSVDDVERWGGPRWVK